MNCQHCAPLLHNYAAAPHSLAAPDRDALETHLLACANCRAELAATHRLIAATAALPRERAPARDLWPGIAQQLTAASPEAPDSAEIVTLPQRLWRIALPLAVAASVAILCVAAGRRYVFDPENRSASWSVAALSGEPSLAQTRVHGARYFHVGQWLETDERSRAKVNVGSIGEVRVEPNSRVRLLSADGNHHRIELARGKLDALIWAPPRLFFVDTPSATAIDLGCAYTLETDEAGDGELHVTAGYVALEHGDREAIVPYGLKCHTRRGVGPGTPYAAEAPAELRAALDAFDFGPPEGRDPALRRILVLSGQEEDITLWHLLARTAGADRAAVYDTLARLKAPPGGITRDGILGGDASMRRAWGLALGIGTLELRR
ncbi:MAG TPA: FecR domain-containing protein [Opitutaceae bacterium]